MTEQTDDVLVLLTADAAWCEPLRAALEKRGVPARVVDVRQLNWEPSVPFPRSWRVVVNRLAARPADTDDSGTGFGMAASVTVFRDMIAALELQSELTGAPRRIVNGSRCHHVGISKCLQASLFTSLELPTPETRLHLRPFVRDVDGSEWLVKPNAGGRGAGIHVAGETKDGSGRVGSDASYAADHVAVLQRRIEPGAQRHPTQSPSGSTHHVHRVEILGDAALYVAHVPIDASQFDNCVGGAANRDGGVLISSSADEGMSIRAAVRGALQIARTVGMELGSVEYLVDADDGAPSFIDINPVSTVVEAASHVIETPPLECQAEWLARQWAIAAETGSPL